VTVKKKSKSSDPKGARKKAGDAKKGHGRMLSRDQQREILALGLLVLALFILLALTPTAFLGARGESWFPSGNFMGPVGGGLGAVLVYYLGTAALSFPILLALTGLRSGDWLSTPWTLRLVVLSFGLLFLVPPGLHVMEPGSGAAGALGAWLGSPLLGGLGAFGSLFLLSALILLLIVATIGWNPLRPLGRGAVQGAGLVGKGAIRAGLGFSGWLQERAERRKAQRAEAESRAMESAASASSFSFSAGEEGTVDPGRGMDEVPNGSGDDPFREQIPEERLAEILEGLTACVVLTYVERFPYRLEARMPAAIPVHLRGNAVDSVRLAVTERGLTVIEDELRAKRQVILKRIKKRMSALGEGKDGDALWNAVEAGYRQVLSSESSLGVPRRVIDRVTAAIIRCRKELKVLRDRVAELEEQAAAATQSAALKRLRDEKAQTEQVIAAKEKERYGAVLAALIAVHNGPRDAELRTEALKLGTAGNPEWITTAD